MIIFLTHYFFISSRETRVQLLTSLTTNHYFMIIFTLINLLIICCIKRFE